MQYKIVACLGFIDNSRPLALNGNRYLFVFE